MNFIHRKNFKIVCLWFYCGALTAICGLSGCSLTVPHGQFDREAEDNLSRFKTAVNTIFQRIDARLEPEKPVYCVVSNEPSAAQQFLENAFQEFLTNKNRKMFLVADDYMHRIQTDNQAGYVVSLQVQTMHVAYEPAKKERKSSAKKLSRNITVQVFYNVIHNQNGAVIVAQVITEQLQDSISEHDIAYVQNNDLPFARAVPPKPGKLRELLEMTTVLSAAGIIVYVLFSTRS